MKVLRAKKYAKTKKHQSETTKEKKKPSLEKKIAEEPENNQNNLVRIKSKIFRLSFKTWVFLKD